jgi:ESS family glutamate:Na+ symporter
VEIVDNVVRIQPFVALTTAIIVLFVGKALNQRFEALREFNISQSVSGGLLVSILLAVIYFVFGIEVQFDLAARPFLAVYFFTAIGINTKLREVLAARYVVVMLLTATIAYMAVQDFIAVSIASALGGAGPEALLAGTVALTGDIQTIIAWAPTFEDDFGIADARETGIAIATFGLVIGSLAGGPIARHLIRRHGLRPETVNPANMGQTSGRADGNVDPSVFLQSILAIHICIIVGLGLNQLLADAGYALPLPVACFCVAIVLTNLIPPLFPKANWPSRSGAMFLIAELSLGILFGMSLIGARLWVITDLSAQHLTIVLAQALATVAITIFVIFRILGRDYDAAVICSGFVGLVLGSKSTAMANMKAVAQYSGTSHMAFIIVPLVAVFCIDVVNRFLIQFFLAWF